jgi:hypothetical protein
MRTAVEKADAIVRARDENKFPMLLVKDCRLWSTGAVGMVEATANFLSASLVELDLEISKGITCTSIRWQRHCVSTPPLNRSTLQIRVWEGRRREKGVKRVRGVCVGMGGRADRKREGRV